jgi:hypothetical protein
MGMSGLNPIPKSQQNLARLHALKGWTRTVGNAPKAKALAEQQNQRFIGNEWIDDANQLSSDLIDYWEENGISEPAAVFVAGEPTMQGWDE